MERPKKYQDKLEDLYTRHHLALEQAELIYPLHKSDKKNKDAATQFENIEIEFQAYLKENELGMGQLLPAFRVSLTGLAMGPSLFDIEALLGKNETIKRLQTALENIK